MRVRCAYTDCKNNKQTKWGYFCRCKEIHITWGWSSDEPEKGEQMKCQQKEKR